MVSLSVCCSILFVVTISGTKSRGFRCSRAYGHHRHYWKTGRLGLRLWPKGRGRDHHQSQGIDRGRPQCISLSTVNARRHHHANTNSIDEKRVSFVNSARCTNVSSLVPNILPRFVKNELEHVCILIPVTLLDNLPSCSAVMIDVF